MSNQLTLDSNQVLRGAGRDSTKLYFVKSMQDLFGWGSKYQPGKSNSPYTWLGALIQTQRQKKLWNDDMYYGKVARPANRGDRKLFTDFSGTPNAGKRADQVFKAGEWMALRMYENMNVSVRCHWVVPVRAGKGVALAVGAYCAACNDRQLHHVVEPAGGG